MWARVAEVMLGIWLMISPFVFGHDGGNTNLWANDLGVGLVIVTLALLSFWQPLRYAHLAIAVAGLWLIVVGLQATHPAPSESQNHILLGLLLVMFAIIPNHANLPPPASTGALYDRSSCVDPRKSVRS